VGESELEPIKILSQKNSAYIPISSLRVTHKEEAHTQTSLETLGTKLERLGSKAEATSNKTEQNTLQETIQSVT
jgi:hypothetical protein